MLAEGSPEALAGKMLDSFFFYIVDLLILSAWPLRGLKINGMKLPKSAGHVNVYIRQRLLAAEYIKIEEKVFRSFFQILCRVTKKLHKLALEFSTVRILTK